MRTAALRILLWIFEKRLAISVLAACSILAYIEFKVLFPEPNIDSAMDAVVLIVVDNKGSGSGFFVSHDGCIMTAWHVIDDAIERPGSKKHSIKVFSRGGHSAAEGIVMAYDKYLDAAIICAKIQTESILRIVPSEGLAEGDKIWAIGHPMGRTWNVTNGIISKMAFRPRFIYAPLIIPRYDIYTSAFISWGNSGGPIIDAWGNAVGMIVEWDDPGIGRPNNMNIAVNGTDLLRFIRTTFGK